MAKARIKGPNEYLSKDLGEIEKIFATDDLYSSLIGIFYNGANDKQLEEASLLRSAILETVNNLKEQGKKTVESEQLTSLITRYYEKSSTIAQQTSINSKNTNYLERDTANLTKIVDSFKKNIFDYNNKNKQAYIIARNDASESEKKTLVSLTAYQALAKRYFALHGKSNYEYSKDDEIAIKEHTGKSTLPNDADLSIREIHDGLRQAYKQTIEISFVKSAAKTNFLKRTGWHLKDVGIIAAIAAGIGVFGAISTIGGFPLAGASSLAIWNFIGGQMVPLFALGLLLGGGTKSILNLRENKRFNAKNGPRDKIRQLSIEEKAKLFNLIKQNTPTKRKSLWACSKSFKQTAIAKGFDSQLINYLSKTKNYKSLVEAEKKLGALGIQYGASPIQLIRGEYYKVKGIEPVLNQSNIAARKAELAPLISPANHLGTILGITGTKGTKKSKDANVVATTNPAKPRTRTPSSPVTSTTPPLAMAAKETTVDSHMTTDATAKKLIEIPETSLEAMAALLKSKKEETQDFTIQFVDKASKIAEYSVELSKGKASLSSRKVENVMNDLTKKMESVLSQGSRTATTSSEGVTIKVSKVTKK